jgi:hypothetical protein
MAVAFLGTGFAADPADNAKTTADTAAQIAALRAQLAAQQKLIEQLQSALQSEMKVLDQVTANTAASSAAAVGTASPASLALPPRAGLGEIASTTPMVPPVPATVAPPRIFTPPSPQAAPAEVPSPLQIKIGDVSIMPVGFMDATMVWRDKDAGSSIGSNFGSVPYNNATTAKLSEFHFSPQNSRIGFRIDGNWKGAHFIGYNEFDFLGTSGSNAIGVTNGAFVPRIRLYWVDVRKDKVEFLAGQSWSMLTPNRKGLSPLPGDIFYSQVMDVNYMAGLTWTRQPGVRLVYHPSDKVAFGISAENPNQYIGGSGGGGQIVLPSALSSLAGAQLDNTSSGYLSTPNVAPDFIAKLAIDPSSRAHIEIAGLQRTFKDYNPNTATTFTKIGGGGSINANLEVVKNLRLITNNFWSDGGGRYMFGEAPDLIVRANGSLSPLHSGSTVNGIEAQLGQTLLWAYYGGIYVGRDVALDANGTSLIGYGYRGSSNSQNRAIQEFTIGFTETFWKDPKYGALSFIGQYEYLTRDPWYWAANIAGGKATHDNTIYLDLRYTLPGGVPSMK